MRFSSSILSSLIALSMKNLIIQSGPAFTRTSNPITSCLICLNDSRESFEKCFIAMMLAFRLPNLRDYLICCEKELCDNKKN
jgi:hypothetical protein